MTQQAPWQTGAFAAVRSYYVKAAAYDAAFNRQADILERRERAVRLTVVAITGMTSLGAFASLFENNPNWWAKLFVFLLAATTSILTAVRQDARWLEASAALRDQGHKWTHQRNRARTLACRLLDRGLVTEDELTALGDADESLVRTNPPISPRSYKKCKCEKTAEFDQEMRVGPWQSDTSSSVPQT